MTTRPRANKKKAGAKLSPPPSPVYPFAAVVGQEEMKLALILSAVAPSLGGVLVMGHRGTGKSTAVRALAALLPEIKKVRGCPFNCDPADHAHLCDDCRDRLRQSEKLPQERAPVPVVELPLGATEDRVCGTIDIERALRDGVRSFEPGLLARANRGFLYVDEVNLLEDHLVDLLLDASAAGRNVVEREGVSFSHPARFVLVGSGNPEEGDLRPQLLDRFGLFAEIRTDADVERRVEIVERREWFERDPEEFARAWASEQDTLRRRLARARRTAAAVEIPRPLLRRIAELCARHEIDGHRGELTIARASRALAAFEGRKVVRGEDVRRVAALALRHRLRRDPLEQSPGGARLDESVEEFFGGDETSDARDGKSKTTETEKRSTRGRDAEESSAAEKDSAGSPGGGGDAGDKEKSSRPEKRSEDGARASRDENLESAPTMMDAALPEVASDRMTPPRGARRADETPPNRSSAAARHVFARRGRYARATQLKPESAIVACDATLRAAAPRQTQRRGQARWRDVAPARRDSESVCRDSESARRSVEHTRRGVESVNFVESGHFALTLRAEDLRFKRFRRKAGTLYILAVDASGSMAANRIGQAKGALARLLRKSYVSRDRVALISFRGVGAQTLLPPSASSARAKSALDALRVGGATPLAAALLRALEIVRRTNARGRQPVRLIFFTDGRANVPLGDPEAKDGGSARRRIAAEIEKLGGEIRRAGVETLVVDTQNRFTAGDEGRALASALGGRYTHLPLAAHGDHIAEAFGQS